MRKHQALFDLIVALKTTQLLHTNEHVIFLDAAWGEYLYLLVLLQQ